jgi:DNA-binding NarL/FixJ family response regulator
MRARRPPASPKNVDPIAPVGLRASTFRLGSDELAILSFPIDAAVVPEVVTESERAIGVALAQGLSNAEIAAARGRSVRTIANQVASLLCKLGVSSRTEAGARFCSATPGPDQTEDEFG